MVAYRLSILSKSKVAFTVAYTNVSSRLFLVSFVVLMPMKLLGRVNYERIFRIKMDRLARNSVRFN